MAQCGGAEKVDAIIAPIIYSLHRQPESWPIADELRNIRIAKTKIRFVGSEIILGHSVWFRVMATSFEVELLFVELTDPTELD